MKSSFATKLPAGETITPYYGEFMVSPCPLELSFNYCSHGCVFCFANLNRPLRNFDAKATARLIADYMNRSTLEADLLKAGYPVLVSNKVDPFAHSNFKQAVPTIEALTNLGIPVSIQTRGGIGLEDVLSFLPPSVWYISINTDNEDLRKTLEPGAPTIESRFQLIETLVARGHKAVVGLNPLVEEWSGDVATLLQRIKTAGASGVWIELLHLSRDQKANLSAKGMAAIGEDRIRKASHLKPCVDDMRFFLDTRAEARFIGLDVFSIGQPEPSKFFDVWRAVYPKTFPAVQDFVNAAFASNQTMFTFDEFLATLGGELPTEPKRMAHYIGATTHKLLTKWTLPKKMTYRQLLRFIWQEPKAKANPTKMQCFAFAGECADAKANEWYTLVDEADNPMILFDESGFGNNLYADPRDYGIEGTIVS